MKFLLAQMYLSYILEIIKTKFTLNYHENDFAATHALGHIMYDY